MNFKFQPKLLSSKKFERCLAKLHKDTDLLWAQLDDEVLYYIIFVIAVKACVYVC